MADVREGHRLETKGAVRIYIRVSTEEQSVERQEHLVDDARRQGYYIAGIYREKNSGAVENRPELQRLIDELQQGDIVIAEKMDRISRLPLPEAEKLIEKIKQKGAKLMVPGVVDFSDVIAKTDDGISRIILETMQTVLLKLSLQMARDDYELRRKRQKEGIALARENGKYHGRRPDDKLHEKILECRCRRTPPLSITETAKLLATSPSTVSRVCRKYRIDCCSN